MNWPITSSARAKSTLFGTRYRVLIIGITIAGILLSVMAFTFVHNLQRAAVKAAFNNAAHFRVNTVFQGYAKSILLVDSVKAYFSATGNVSGDDFQRFTQSLLIRFPGVQALEWIPKVPEKDRRKYELNAQLVFPGFQFRERTKRDTMTPANLRSEYYPVYYLTPYRGNEAALGFDLGSEPARLESINSARDTGKIVFSPGLKLVQERADQYGFLVLDPIYWNQNSSTLKDRQVNFIGLIAGVFRIDDVVKSSLLEVPPQGLDFSIYDNSPGFTAQNLLYTQLARTRNNLPLSSTALSSLSEELTYSENIQIGGRTLTIKVRAAPGYFNTAPNEYAWGSLLVGLFSTLFLVIYIQTMRRHLQALFDSELSLNKAQEIAHIGSWEWDIQKNKMAGSDEAYRIFGKRPQAFVPNFQSYLESVHPDDQSLVKSTVEEALRKNKTSFSTSHRIVLSDGDERFLHYLVEVAYEASGKPVRLFGIMQDITERHLKDVALTESEARLDLALQSANMGVWSFDIVTHKRYFDDQTCRLLGIDSATFTGTAEEFFSAVHPDDREMLKTKLAQVSEQNIPYESEFRVIWPDGSTRYIAGRGRVVRDEQGRPLKINAIAFDVSKWKETQDQIHSLAYYDPLTELPNRRLLMDRLQQALISSARNGLVGAILFINLDNFKTINDTLGHALGDSLLQQVAARLTSCVREEDTVARIGGDEFVVMLEYLSADEPEAATQTESIGEKLLAAVSQPYQIASHECRSTCSIGITLFNDRQQTTDELLKQADIAMYQAKKAGRNTFCFFDTQMQEIVTARAKLESELRNAIQNQQLQLYYQIQVDERRNPIGVEALIRWNHPERGLVAPLEFIPLAEETGLILPIGQWVLETACAQLKVWEQGEPTRELVLAVNVSAREFLQADFVAQIQACVRRHAIDPKRLKLELTESLLLENIEDTVLIMNVLNDMGIQFSLDDFGTGYSSLQYLKHLPLDQIKIDQSFVRDLAMDSGDRAIVRTIVAMAKSLNLDVIAEGVETEEQRQLLLNKGCTHYQGYLFGRPIPIEQFDTQLKKRIKNPGELF